LRFLLCLILFTVPELSKASTIDFSELGLGSPINVNGLHTQGVQFGFSSGVAIYNGVAGTSGTAEWSLDPILLGPTTGALTLGFDLPTSILRFDILLQSIFPIDDSGIGFFGGPAYTVLLSTGTIITGGTAPQPSGLYSEGQFQYSGTPISGATITFFNGIDLGGMPVTAFGIDNLTFGVAAPQTGVPEPGTSWILGAGLLVAGLWKRRTNR
jgi:hypothetical protein